MLTKFQKHLETKENDGKRQKAKGKKRFGSRGSKNIRAKQFLASCITLGSLLPIGVLAQDECENRKPEAGSILAMANAKPRFSQTVQDVPARNPQALPPIERVGVNVNDQTPITLDEAIALALANNKDINSSRIDVELARFDLNAAKGAYDPRIAAQSYYEHRETATASAISGSASGKITSTDQTNVATLSGNTPLAGGVYQIDFSSSRQTTDNLFSSLNPTLPTGVTLTYTQPLFKGLRTDDNRRRIEIAKKNLSLTDSQFRQRAIEVITRVQQAYWDLVFALKNLQVQNDAVKQARTQLESNRRQVEQGTLAPIDIVSAEAQLTLFEQNVYIAQEGVTRAENTLKSLLLPERTATLWSKALAPTTPVSLDPPRIELDDAIKLALASRPELDQVAKTAEINRVNQKFFSDQLKPQIDLFGIYTAAGLAGSLANRGPNPFTAGTLALTERVNEISKVLGFTPLPVNNSSGGVPQAFIGGYGQSLNNLFGFDFPTVRVGVRFSFPVGNRTAEANYGRSLAEGRKIENQRQQIEQSIEAEVRNTLQAVRSAQARLASAVASRDASEKQYESEQRKFQAGLSTVFLVLQRQQELIAARGREVQAQTDLNKAIAEFQRATGSTFKAHNITVKADKTAPQLEQHNQP
ncbi:MAG: TolC family protein [Acidobacteriota bacterium]